MGADGPNLVPDSAAPSGCVLLGGETVVVELQGVLETEGGVKDGADIGRLDLSNTVRWN